MTINAMARDPAVNEVKMQALLAMHRELLADQRRIEFFDALAALATHLPAIRKDGRLVIEKGGQKIQNTPYATWENIHRAVTPILASDGFALMHQTESAPDGLLRIRSTLARNGHSESTFYDLPIDASGSKNNVQGRGSSTSYGKRYNTINLLNIRTEGEDNDGAGTPVEIERISQEQALELTMTIRDQYEDDAKATAKITEFCRTMSVAKIADIPAAELDVAKNKLGTWLRARAKQ